MSITTLGIVWIGLLGSFAVLILRFSTIPAAICPSVGAPTRCSCSRSAWSPTTSGRCSSVGRRPDAAAAVDQPEQDGRGIDRRRVAHDRGDGRRRHRRVERHLDVAGAPVAAGDRDLDHGAAGRPRREHVQAQPRREGLRLDHQGPRRGARPVRRVPVHAPGRVLPDASCSNPGPSDRAVVANDRGRIAHVSPIRVAIAGSTGSIGTQTLDVIRAEGARRVRGGRRSASDRRSRRSIAQALEFRPRLVAVADARPARRGRGRACRSAEVVDELADARRAGRRGGQRRRRLRRPAGDDRDAAAGQAPGAGQQGEPDRRRAGRAAAAGDPGRRAGPGRQRALRGPPVPAGVAATPVARWRGS